MAGFLTGNGGVRERNMLKRVQHDKPRELLRAKGFTAPLIRFLAALERTRQGWTEGKEVN